jgi:hypothetical protein
MKDNLLEERYILGIEKVIRNKDFLKGKGSEQDLYLELDKIKIWIAWAGCSFDDVTQKALDIIDVINITKENILKEKEEYDANYGKFSL